MAQQRALVGLASMVSGEALVDRNSGRLPENMLELCDQEWDEERLGQRRTITCSENAKRHAARVPVSEVAHLLVLMVQRLMQMRMLDDARLFGRWWMIVIDGTLRDRGHDTPKGEARLRYVVEAKLVGPEGTMFPLMTEFRDMYDQVRDKEDCELKAFLRLAERLRETFPRTCPSAYSWTVFIRYSPSSIS